LRANFFVLDPQEKPMNEISLPRVNLAHLPTPIHSLPRLSAELGGPQLWVKRDDQTGLAFGGNKVRKLEFLLAQAQAHEARTLITRGAIQSNHCRQTAAAAANQGFDCILVLTGSQPQNLSGNTLLDKLLGAEFVWTGEDDPEIVIQETFNQAQSDGRSPYMIPYGGSNQFGVAAYAAAMAEFMDHGIHIDRIVLATSSGGTQAGMLVGAQLYGFSGQILGISIDKTAEEMKNRITALATETAAFLNHTLAISPDEVNVDDNYLGGGYGIVGDLERSTLTLVAQLEGLLLDPVYTGRAAGGMVDLICRGEIGSQESVLFWHTGGTPALFAYAEEFE
jgi:D-cysteine desulfhydrase family pyridoxal phosphate-dependent enzyme